MEKRIFVISDLHGQFVLLQLLLERIGFTENDELYILGDIMDRGPNSIDIYYFVKAMDNIHMIKGNHEIMMRQSMLAAIMIWIQKDRTHIVYGNKMVGIKQLIVLESIYKKITFLMKSILI